MRRLRAMGLALALVFLAGCGDQAASPESVARAWSNAINTGDNDGAADLFATGAKIVQQGHLTLLRTHEDAVAWNAALPCSGKIVSIAERDERATVTFRLGERASGACDGPGATARALFRIHNGKIVLWHQLAGQAGAPGQTI